MSVAHSQNNDFLSPFMRALAPYLILALVVFSAYGNVFDNAFLFDDSLLIEINDYLRDWKYIPNILMGSTTSGAHIDGGFYRPVQILLYLFAFQLGNGEPFWFHLLNVSLHIANTCFVYRIGTKLGFNPKGVFLAALLWGVHPIHTEAVTYISGTADPLAAFFCLWAIAFLLPDFSPQKILKIIPLFLLGLVSKEALSMFPLLVMACLFYTNEKRLNPRTYFRTWPLWAISLVYIYWRMTAPGFDGPQSYERFYAMPQFGDLKVYANEPIYRVYTFLASLPQYFRLLIWPTDLHMERSFPIQPNFWAWGVFTGVIMILFAASHIIYSCKIKRGLELSWGLMWFAAAHAPDTGLLVPMNSLFLEHWMYLPSVGLFLGVAQTFTVLMKDHARVLPVLSSSAAAVLVLVFSVKTYNQNKIWHDPVSFYNNIFRYGEKSSRARNNLALYYSDQSQYDKAIEQFKEAIGTADIYAETRYNLAVTYLRKSQDKKTISIILENLERSIEIQPNFYRSYQLMGDIYDIFLHDKEKGDFYRARAKQFLNQQK